MVICLERGADLHMAQLMPLPLTVSCFSKIQIGFTFLVPAHLGSPGKGPLNGCVCVCITQVIGCEDYLRNDLYCVEWGVKLCSNQPTKLASLVCSTVQLQYFLSDLAKQSRCLWAYYY